MIHFEVAVFLPIDHIAALLVSLNNFLELKHSRVEAVLELGDFVRDLDEKL